MAGSTPAAWPRPPLHPGFIAAGSALLVAACLTDAMYCHTALWQWANFSAWLIAAGLVVALVAAIVLAIDVFARRTGRIAWLWFGAVAAAALLSVLNVFVHSRDAWTSVAPQGMTLSLVVAVLLLVAALRGWRLTDPETRPAGERP